MVDGYMAQAELVIASDLQQQEKEFSAKYQELLYEYDLINKTTSEYYDIATQDMQLQRQSTAIRKTMQLVSLFFILYLIVWMIYFPYPLSNPSPILWKGNQ